MDQLRTTASAHDLLARLESALRVDTADSGWQTTGPLTFRDGELVAPDFDALLWRLPNLFHGVQTQHQRRRLDRKVREFMAQALVPAQQQLASGPSMDASGGFADAFRAQVRHCLELKESGRPYASKLPLHADVIAYKLASRNFSHDEATVDLLAGTPFQYKLESIQSVCYLHQGLLRSEGVSKTLTRSMIRHLNIMTRATRQVSKHMRELKRSLEELRRLVESLP